MYWHFVVIWKLSPSKCSVAFEQELFVLGGCPFHSLMYSWVHQTVKRTASYDNPFMFKEHFRFLEVTFFFSHPLPSACQVPSTSVNIVSAAVIPNSGSVATVGNSASLTLSFFSRAQSLRFESSNRAIVRKLARSSACNSVRFYGLWSVNGPMLILRHKNGLFLVKKVHFHKLRPNIFVSYGRTFS